MNWGSGWDWRFSLELEKILTSLEDEAASEWYKVKPIPLYDACGTVYDLIDSRNSV